MSLKQIWQAANPKGHLLTAISFLIPIVCGSGFIIAIGMGLGGTVQDTLTPGQFDVWQAMATLGAKALGLLPVVIAVGISGSIAGKPGIAPGFVVGLAANTISAGFIGGMIGGYIAGYIALAIIKNVKVPDCPRVDADADRSLFCLHYQLHDYGLYHRYAYRYLYGSAYVFPEKHGHVVEFGVRRSHRRIVYC
jgi:hypothetical protein